MVVLTQEDTEMAICELCDKKVKKGKVYCSSCTEELAENEACDRRDSRAAAPAPAAPAPAAPAPAPATGSFDLTPGASASAFLGKAFGW
jgi:hypothetical protein